MTGSADLVAPLTAWMLLPEHGHQQCSVDLEYDSADPFAVSAVIYGTDPVRWTFARDLLHEGLIGDAGIGDVRFRHAAHVASDAVWMQLIGVDADAWVRLPLTGCAEFLSQADSWPTTVVETLPTLDDELRQLLEQEGGTPSR